jgi:hypothetical protein
MNPATASSYARDGSVHEVCRLASLVALAANATARSAVSGQAPARVWYSRYSVFLSGQPDRLCGSLRAAQRRTAAIHASGSSDRRLIRARTSALRLVSWVDSVSMASGQRAVARAMAW